MEVDAKHYRELVDHLRNAIRAGDELRSLLPPDEQITSKQQEAVFALERAAKFYLFETF